MCGSIDDCLGEGSEGAGEKVTSAAADGCRS